MPLVLDPANYSEESLAALVGSLRLDLVETLELAEHPRGAVRDPSGPEAAAQLLRATIALLDRGEPRAVQDLAVRANLAYAALVAAIDLIKSHVDVPRVPAPRRSPG